MKAFLAILLFLPTLLFAAPFIVSDADPTGAADKCAWQEGTAAIVESNTVVTPPALTGACRIDATGFAVGVHNLQVWFKSTAWGVTSGKVPFVFQRPSATGTAPANLRLEP